MTRSIVASSNGTPGAAATAVASAASSAGASPMPAANDRRNSQITFRARTALTMAARWLARLVLLSCLAVDSIEAGQPLGRLPKRSRVAPADGTGSNSAASLLARAAEMLNLWTPAHVYHMDSADARNALIDTLWTGSYESVIGHLTSANPQVVSFFEQLRSDDSETPPRLEAKKSRPRFEGVLAGLFRARSQKVVPLEVAALSVAFMEQRVPQFTWNAIAHLTHSVMSHSWTEQFCEDALKRDPGPPYETATGMSAAVFDNFMIRVGYGSYATHESSARTFQMTNWATAFLPANVLPAGFSIDAMLGAGGIFRADLYFSDFLDLLSPVAPDLMANKRMRWSYYLDLAIAGTLWDKEPYASPFPPTHFHYHNPIFDRLQSSYDDVNFELDLMRNSVHHRYADCIQLGGDGLSYMRLIHRLSQNSQRFLETKPITIPRLGEAPHGKYHVMHGDWRLWAPLLMRLAKVVNNQFVKSDPIVSEFNEHEHFLRIVVEACAEYVVEISRTGSDYHHCAHFLAAAERNLSFAYVCFFLFLSGFKYAQMRTAIRKDDSKLLDKIWRENLATARTDLANKTNYSQMTVSLIYWGFALVEPLQTAFHNSRTLRWLYSHVGWDVPIEQLNAWVKEAVVSNITEDSIKKFIRRLNFTHIVRRGLENVMYAFRKRDSEHLKPIDSDKTLIKEFLRANIGSDYATATAPSDANLLGLDLADWGGNRNPRGCSPWRQMERAMQDYRDYVEKNVEKLFPWHHWL
jgi:hypothetical protein